MVISATPGFNIAEPPREWKYVPRLAKISSLLWSLAGLAALAGLLASGQPHLGAITGMAVAAQPAALTGQFLVARDELRDPRFARSVVYVVHHDAGERWGSS